jgi:MoaA/NifB/PqqE/SkfB family radical SAM enzyme
MKRARTFLDFDIFKKTIDEISYNSLTSTISFAGNGEPLLDNKIREKIKYCKLKGLKTVITTNGVLIDRITPDILKNQDALYISWQTFNESSFKMRNINLNYDNYETKILNFLNENYNKSTKIILSMMFIRKRKRFMMDLLPDSYYALFQQNGRGLYKTLKKIEKIIPCKQEYFEKIYQIIKRDIRFLNNEHRLNKNLFLNIDEYFDWGGNLQEYSKDFFRVPCLRGSCKVMMAGPLVLANGEVSICCQDAEGNVTVGNLNNSSLIEILLSKKYQYIYNGFKNNKVILNQCQKCKGYWKHKNKYKNLLYNIDLIYNSFKFRLKRFLLS